MEEVSTIGLDLAKSVFQVHGIDAAGRVVVRRQLRRGEVLGFFARLRPCLVGMEACATAHHWGRELIKLGHTVKLMPPAYVKPYVKRGKTDAADAEAIAEAVTRPTMRFVAVKSMDQQAVLMLHKVRDLLVRQRTMLINALRGHLAEFGVVTARGPAGHPTDLAIYAGALKMPFDPWVERCEGVEIEASDVLRWGVRAAERLIRALPSYDGWSAWTVSVHDERGSLARHCPFRRIRIVATLSISRRAFSNGLHTRPQTRTRPEARGIIDAPEAGAMPVHYQPT
jgi:hypothetical protein